MWMAVTWGFVSGLPMLIGGLISTYKPVSKKILGFIMAFGAGALIAATTFDLLLEEGVQKSSLLSVSIGFILGGLVFTAYDWFLWRKGHRSRKLKNSDTSSNSSSSAGTAGLALFVGSMLDAIPEAMMVGYSTAMGGVSWTLLVAVVISNFPEGLSSTDGFRQAGYSKKKILLTWTAVVFITTLSGAAGNYFLPMVPEQIESFISSFSAGAIIAMVSVTMLPEAYEKANPLIGLASISGLLISLALNTLQ
ncbi:ZIP family metal transporter [Bacillus salacetis]|uniref:ZIP family metal transporter n=1 Tax=Bacillus salacetis TaxID=2315464 RepID=UPI003B9DFA26